MSQNTSYNDAAPLLPDLLRQCEAALAGDGYCYLPGTDPMRTARAAETFDALTIGTRSGSSRLPAAHSLISLLLEQTGVRELLRGSVGSGARPVRAITFDKTDKSNWFVPWHQDRTIAVARRVDHADVRHWTVKNSVPHCEPPIGLLESMVTLRWHIDPVLAEDGPLRILPATHRIGRLERPAIQTLAATTAPVDLLADAGDVIAMRPLLVHASSRRRFAGRRRIVHVEFSARNPPPPLQWAWHSSNDLDNQSAA